MSTHSIERAQERGNINRKQAIEMIKRAQSRGKKYGDYKHSKEKNYLLAKTQEGSIPVYYAGYIFIFDDSLQICITMYEAPYWFGKKVYYNGKERIKHPKKYIKYYPFEEIA